jgi:hypothetical protein
MFVFTSGEKDISNSIAANPNVFTGQQALSKKAKQTVVITKAKSKTSGTKKIFTKTIPARRQLKKELIQKKTYSEEPVVKDSLWNIYNGNPGFYCTTGDTVNFGNVTTISDSAFLKAHRTIIPTTIKPYGIIGKELVIPNQDWVLGIILILWMIFASVRVGFLKYLGQIFISLINLSEAARLYRQRGYKTMYGAVRLDFIFHLIVPLSVFQILEFYKIDISGYPSFILFLALLLIINGYFFIKNSLYGLVGSLAMLKEQTDESVFNIKLYHKVLGLFLLPVVTVHAVIAGSNFITVWIMAGLVVITYLATVVRNVYLGHKKDISIFYLILYLCTLEILPLLLIFKLVLT